MDDPSAQFQHEDLIDILWRQDVDLGVERDIFDGCLRQREEETTRARERELKRERELEMIMQRLQKLDKETGEFLPSPSSVNSQAVPLSETLHSTVFTQRSPVTQNPLLSALLFSQKSQKPPSQEQAFSELLSRPDLQYYLDVLESEASSLPLDDITEICHQNLPEPQRENSTDTLCGVTQTISDSFEVAQPLSSIPSDPVEILETCIQMFSDPRDPTPSPSNTIYSCSTPENQVILPKCQINSSDSTLSEFCSYTINTSSLSKPEQLNSAPQTLLQFEECHILLGFDDSASVGSVDLETSLYAADTLSNGQSDKDELESILSDYTDLLPLSLHSEAVEATLCETVTYAQHQTQNESTPEYSQREPQANLSTTSGAAEVQRVCRDEQRAQAMSLPFGVHDIINLPVEAFNEAISSCKLNHTQNSLIRDIRRRGKNKMAAQSCRKRKMNSLIDLEEEIEDLKREKEQIKEENEKNTRELHETKVKLRKLYNEVFRQLRDEHGNSYNPREYKLQHSTDGTVYLLPRRTADKTNTPTEDLPIAV
ncbi:nuclear factor erythroid 2-related factor 2b isoform X1 [Sinocyclocheilus grahami]|uniref:Nuclear factor erythroid 2-related factor 2-like n=1 Tax=Sinocyclocheilus grahami TaxID=75366 RepID=A0A672NTK8_SINGR|nr:PREDICTED: nuclear factor erythroid 2-related factor 2-like isoform X1 [Sinocyclocheilus grahami]